MKTPSKIGTSQPARERRQHPPGTKVQVGPQPISHVRHGWHKRSKLDVRAAAEEIHAAFPGRLPRCDFMDGLRASKKTGIDLLREAIALPGYLPEQTAMDSLAASSDMWTGQALIDWQTFWVDEITSYPFARLGGAMQVLIRDRGDLLVPAVWPKIIQWFAGHPLSPKGWLNQKDILAKIPNTDAISALLTGLPVGRAVWLTGKTVRGGRPV